MKDSIVQDTTLRAVRLEVFAEVFDEFAFLTLREHAPELLAQMLESLVANEPSHAAIFDPYRFSRTFIAGAARYVASGQAEAFYAEGKSLIVSKLTVCIACSNGEHQRCYLDAARFWYCTCPCSAATAASPKLTSAAVPRSPNDERRSMTVGIVCVVIVILVVAALVYLGD